MKKFYVYLHRNTVNGKGYVGWTSTSMEWRWRRHCYSAQEGSRLYFHAAIRKYGIESFTHEILDVLATEAGAKRAEKLWIKRLGTFGSGYNLTMGGEGVMGLRYPVSEETRQKMSKAHKGRKLTPAHIARLREVKRGVKLGPHSPESNELRSKALKGRSTSDETRKKIAESKRGTTHSPETRQRISEAGKGRVTSAETRQRLSEAGKRRVFSPETKRKISEALKRKAAEKRGEQLEG